MSRARLGLGAVAVAAYLLIPYRWALSTRTHDAARAKRIRGEAASVEARIAHARAVAADRPGWARRVAAVRAVFPPTVDVSGEMDQLRTIAAATGVRVVSITSDPPAPSFAAAAPVPIQLRLEIQGPATAIEAFTGRLRLAPRLFTTTRAALDFGTDTRQPVTVDLTAEVWTWPAPTR